MIRRIAACSAAVLVALAVPSSAAPSTLSDPRGDWAVPSQDIVGGGLSADASGRLVGTLKLAAPLGDLPGSYHLVFYRGECDSYVATLDWRGPSLPSTSTLDVSTWCSKDLVPGVQDPRPAPETSMPAPATVMGGTITWTFPALPDFAAGQRLRGPAAIAAPNPELLLGFGWADSNGNSGEHWAGDLAFGSGEYVVGSTR